MFRLLSSPLPRAVGCVARISLSDLGAVCGITAACSLLGGLGVPRLIFALSHDPDAYTIPFGAVLGLLTALLCAFVLSLSLFAFTWAFGVRLGLPRRHALAACWVWGLCVNAVLLALASALGRLWQAADLAAGREPFDLLAKLPGWAWGALAVLPLAVCCAASGLVARFGRRAGWAIYALFLAVCLTASLWLDPLLDSLSANRALMATLPFGLFAFGALCAAVGCRLLMRAEVLL